MPGTVPLLPFCQLSILFKTFVIYCILHAYSLYLYVAKKNCEFAGAKCVSVNKFTWKGTPFVVIVLHIFFCVRVRTGKFSGKRKFLVKNSHMIRLIIAARCVWQWVGYVNLNKIVPMQYASHRVAFWKISAYPCGHFFLFFKIFQSWVCKVC